MSVILLRLQCGDNCCTSIYRKTSNISRTLASIKNVDHSDVVGTSPVGAAPTTSSFNILYTAARTEEKHLSLGIGATYIRDLTLFFHQNLLRRSLTRSKAPQCRFVAATAVPLDPVVKQ